MSSGKRHYLRPEYLDVMAAQSGVISARQCMANGLSKAATYRRSRSGVWRLILPGVFLSSTHSEGWEQRCAAACCWQPSGALTSLTAAHLLGLTEGIPATVDLLLVGSPKSPAPWLRMHATAVLPESDKRAARALVVTTPERTLIELAAHLSVRKLEMMLDAALRERLSTLSRIEERLRDLRTPGRGGTAVLAALVAERQGDRSPVESALETLLKRCIRNDELPAVEQQVVVTDGSGFVGRLDFAYRDNKIAIEADSVSHHLNRESFEKDRVRDVRMTSLGWRVLRFTYRQIADEPGYVVASIRAALRLSP